MKTFPCSESPECVAVTPEDPGTTADELMALLAHTDQGRKYVSCSNVKSCVN